MKKQWNTVKTVLDRIFYPPFFAAYDAYFSTYKTLKTRIKCVLVEYFHGYSKDEKYNFKQYNELIPLILNEYIKGNQLDSMLSEVVPHYNKLLYYNNQLQPLDINEFTNQLKILHLLLHKGIFDYIDSNKLNKLPCPETDDEAVRNDWAIRILFKVCFIEEAERYLPALIERLQPNQLQIATVIIYLCKYKLNQKINDIDEPRLDVVYNSMIILYRMIDYKLLLHEYPEVEKELKTKLITSLQGCYEHHKIHFLISLFYHSFVYDNDSKKTIDKAEKIFIYTNINDLFQIIEKHKVGDNYYIGQNIDVDIKAKVVAYVFKLYWQKKEYNICNMILKQKWALDATKTLNNIFYTLSNLYTVEKSKDVMELVMKYQELVDIGFMERLLQKHIYHISCIGVDKIYKTVREEYLCLLDYISTSFKNFKIYPHCIFQYYTILNLPIEFFMMSLIYFPKNKLERWCEMFNRYSSDTYALKAAIENPKIIYFLHSFMREDIRQSDKIVKMDACCFALAQQDVNINNNYSDEEISMGKYINVNWVSLTSYLRNKLDFNFKEHPDLIKWCMLIVGTECYKQTVVSSKRTEAATSSPPL